MTYTTAQILAAAEQAEVSMIDAQHICDTLVKMNENRIINVGEFYKVINDDSGHCYKIGEIVKCIRYDYTDDTYQFINYQFINTKGKKRWITQAELEPTTETF